jgi:hypothetical protein
VWSLFACVLFAILVWSTLARRFTILVWSFPASLCDPRVVAFCVPLRSSCWSLLRPLRSSCGRTLRHSSIPVWSFLAPSSHYDPRVVVSRVVLRSSCGRILICASFTILVWSFAHLPASQSPIDGKKAWACTSLVSGSGCLVSLVKRYSRVSILPDVHYSTISLLLLPMILEQYRSTHARTYRSIDDPYYYRLPLLQSTRNIYPPKRVRVSLSGGLTCHSFEPPTLFDDIVIPSISSRPFRRTTLVFVALTHHPPSSTLSFTC